MTAIPFRSLVLFLALISQANAQRFIPCETIETVANPPTQVVIPASFVSVEFRDGSVTSMVSRINGTSTVNDYEVVRLGVSVKFYTKNLPGFEVTRSIFNMVTVENTRVVTVESWAMNIPSSMPSTFIRTRYRCG
jgi:hypothetical protein